MRDDINIFFILHTEDITSDNSIVGYKVATVGKLLDTQYNPVEVVPMVLYSDIKFDDKGNATYGFYTHRTKIGSIEIPAKCFAAGTKIIMSDGSLKNIEDIKEGDFVMGTNNKPCKVKNTHTGYGDMYLVHQNCGIDYIVNSEHILCTDKGEIPTKEIINSNLDYKGYKAAIDYNNSIEHPYFIGLWLGDGDKSSTSITTMDFEIEEYCKNLAKECNLNFTTYSNKSSRAKELNLGSDIPHTRKIKKLTLDNRFIEEYDSLKEAAVSNNISNTSGISHCASGKYKHCGGFKWEYGDYVKNNCLREELLCFNLINNKHIPEEFLTISLKDRKEILAGLIDSDGTKSDNRYVISTAINHFAKGVQKLANSCGYNATISIYHNPVYEKDYYRIIISGNVEDIPVKISRKKIVKNSTNTNLLTIESVEDGNYYGFELEGDCKTFLLEDYTVVHNSPAEMFEEDFIPNDLGVVVKAMNEFYN